MRGKLTPPSVVLRPLKPLGNLLTRLFGKSRSNPPSPALLARHDSLDSERRLSFMLESVPVNLWSTDARLNITFSQGAGLHLIGTSANEQVGMTLYEVLKTRDPGFTPLAAHLRALQGELVRYETNWRGRSFETRVEPLRAGDGRISGTVGIAIDVTDRKSLYSALQTQNVYFATLFENAPEAIAILDEHDHIIRINGQFTTMFGYTEDESVGQNINDLIVAAELVVEGKELTARVAAGEKLRVEALRRHKDGRTLWVAIGATPFGAAAQPGP